jgi:DNA-binding MarR family transcriptional regulator
MKLTPSARKVLEVIKARRVTTFNMLREETKMPERTLKEAIRILKELGLIEVKICLDDTRRRFYCITAKAEVLQF